jgi:hypothetical protein
VPENGRLLALSLNHQFDLRCIRAYTAFATGTVAYRSGWLRGQPIDV